MILNILIILGVVNFIDALFIKFGIWDLIALEGSKVNSEFVFQLSRCEFCLKFHLATVSTLVLICFTGFEWGVLIVPVVVSGLIHLINK
jgi:hypothetical protein